MHDWPTWWCKWVQGPRAIFMAVGSLQSSELDFINLEFTGTQHYSPHRISPPWDFLLNLSILLSTNI